MTAEDGDPFAVTEHAGGQARTHAEDPRRLQLAAALEEGTPIILGDHLPKWTPQDEAEPPARLVINADVLRQVLLDRELVARADPRGLTLKGAVIQGKLDLGDTEIDYPISLIGCRLTASLTLEQATLRALNLNGSHLVGVVELPGAHIAGPLVMTGATIDGVNSNGDSLVAENVRASSDVLLDENFTSAGAIRLTGAHIAGTLVMKGATLNGINGLIGDRLRAEGGTFLDKGSRNKTFTAAGAIRLPGARIGGQLVLRGATLGGPIWLTGAHVKGQLSLRGAELNGANPRGDSLIADHLQADSDVVLDNEFTAVGGIRLSSAHIGGQLNLRGANLTGAKAGENILTAARLRVDSDVLFDGGFKAAGPILLRLADIGNLVVGERQALPRLGDVTGWRIGDVHGVIRADRETAADWLSSQPAAQPWQELASAYERNGQPADARWMRYRSAVQSTRNTKGFMRRLLRRIYRVTTGHGYYPLVALIWLLAIFALAWSLTAVWEDSFTTATTDTIRANLSARDEAAATSGNQEDPPIPEPIPGRVQAVWCTDDWDVPCLIPAVYALTTAFPAASTTQLWVPPAEGWGLALTIAFYVLRLLAWVFTAILLAGLTGLLRKQT